MFTSKTPLQRLRDKFWMSDLPDTIDVPAMGDRPAAIAIAIESATVDDLSFAIQALGQRSSALSSQVEALKRVHDLARRAGATGAVAAIEAAARKLETS